jgi:hypothetical protein
VTFSLRDKLSEHVLGLLRCIICVVYDARLFSSFALTSRRKPVYISVYYFLLAADIKHRRDLEGIKAGSHADIEKAGCKAVKEALSEVP